MVAGRGALWGPLCKDTNPSHGTHPHDLTACQRPHPLTVTLGLRFNTGNTNVPFSAKLPPQCRRLLLSGVNQHRSEEVSTWRPTPVTRAPSITPTLMCPGSDRRWRLWEPCAPPPGGQRLPLQRWTERAQGQASGMTRPPPPPALTDSRPLHAEQAPRSTARGQHREDPERWSLQDSTLICLWCSARVT